MAETLSIHAQRTLFRQVAEGDRVAFRQVFDMYRSRLYGAAFKASKSEHAAEDIVQDIFTALWESRSLLKDIENPTAYVLTIAYNKSFRYLKTIAADAGLVRNLSARAAEIQNETDQWLDGKETDQLIRKAISELPAQRQLIYRMSREEGLSHEEIARRLELSPLTVKTQIKLALRSLRASLSHTALAGAILVLKDLL